MSASLLPPGFDSIDEEPEPSSSELASITTGPTEPYQQFNQEPFVALEVQRAEVPVSNNDLLVPTPRDWVFQVLDEETKAVISGQDLTLMPGATIKAQIQYCERARWEGKEGIWLFRVFLAGTPVQPVWIQRDGNFWRMIEAP